MNVDENDIARFFDLLNVDDAPRPEHREALRKKVLAAYDTVAETHERLRCERGELNRETGARLLAFFGLGTVATLAQYDRPRRESRREQESSPSVGRSADIVAAERLLGFFGLPVAS